MIVSAESVKIADSEPAGYGTADDREPCDDADLAHLKGLKSLTNLGLDHTEVTDAGLVRLAGLVKLTVLSLPASKVTATGVEDLAKALPKCKITWDGGVIEPK